MGLLDSVIGSLAQGGGNGGQADLMNVVAGLLGSGGGLAGLVNRFEQGGLGHVIGSWISSGQNLPISPEQLKSVLGNDTIAQIAQQLGLSHGDAASQLAQVLPQVVDHVTPQGQMPAGGLGDLGSLLGSLSIR